MKLTIPEHCEIRWQAALAVVEDLQEDTRAVLDMDWWGWPDVEDWENPTCGTSGCYAGWMAAAPYCRALGLRGASQASRWLLGADFLSRQSGYIYNRLFHPDLGIDRTRAQTLALIKRNLQAMYKEATGKTLKAPLTFYVEDVA